MAEPKDDETETEAQDAAERRKARRAARAKAREEARAKEADETEDEGSEGEGDEGDESDEEEGSEDAESEGEESEQAEDGSAEAPKPNRRERRRRKKLGDAEAAPKDRNARVRAQHKQRKRVEAEDESLTPLSTSEMLDDAIARGTARAGKWAKTNAAILQFVLIAAVLGGAGYGVYTWQSSSKAEVASTDLMVAVNADRGRIDPAGTKPSANDEEEILPVFKTASERNVAALTGYRKARSARADSGTALLARLGEAGVLLDQRSFDEALAAYREVKGSPLAAADPDVRGRCIEGVGFALEGKGDLDGAVKAFKELETITGIKIYKELGMYHQARLLAAKGEKDVPLKLIKEARERLQTTGEARNATYLIGVLDELQRKVDPNSMPKRNLGGAGRQPSLEELQKLQQQVLQEIEKGKNSGHQDEH